jgi:hypothetical protein
VVLREALAVGIVDADHLAITRQLTRWATAAPSGADRAAVQTRTGNSFLGGISDTQSIVTNLTDWAAGWTGSGYTHAIHANALDAIDRAGNSRAGWDRHTRALVADLADWTFIGTDRNDANAVLADAIAIRRPAGLAILRRIGRASTRHTRLAVRASIILAVVSGAEAVVAESGQSEDIDTLRAILRLIGNAVTLETGRAVRAFVVADVGKALAVDADAIDALDRAIPSLIEPVRDAFAILADLTDRTFDRRADASGGRIAAVDRAQVAILAVDLRGTELLTYAVDAGRAIRAARSPLAAGSAAFGTSASPLPTPDRVACPVTAKSAATFRVFVANTLIGDADWLCLGIVQAESSNGTSRRDGKRAFQHAAARGFRRERPSKAIEPMSVH